MNVRRALERIPADRGAEERAWQVVRAAYAERERVQQRARRRWMLGGAALVAVVAAAAVSSPGRAVVNAVRRSIGITHAAPALFKLPAPGRLLVSGSAGTWVVSPDGSRRRLGAYPDAAWSPHGLFVIAANANSVAAVDPRSGDVHWSLGRPRVASPSWGGSRIDTRVAYLSGDELRIVAGDGTGDAARGPAARVPPAWRPGSVRQLAYVTRDGHVRLLGAWRSARAYAGPRQLVWSPDGSHLLLVTARRLVLFEPASGRAQTLAVPGVRAAAISRAGRIAVVRGRSILVLGAEQATPVFSARVPLAGLVWSPNGRWLLTSLPAADQWIFVGRRRVLAVSHIADQFGGTAALDGWVSGA
jgi:hypothetical protein